MNKIYFCRADSGFYHTEVHGKNIPEQSLEISKELYQELLAGQSNGQVISVSSAGLPQLEQRESLMEYQNFMHLVDSELKRIRLEIEKIQDSDNSSIGTISEWRNYRKLVRSWTNSVDFPSNPPTPPYEYS